MKQNLFLPIKNLLVCNTRTIFKSQVKKFTCLLLGSTLSIVGYRTNAETPTSPPGKFYTSWMGNTYMDNNGKANVTESITDIAVSSNGHLFSAGYAETWGGGATFNSSNGSFIARYDRFETGFGDPVGCVVADNNFVYYGSGKGIIRAPHGGDWTYTRYLTDTDIQGLYLKDGKLYASDYKNGRIRVLNTATMTEERSWACDKPTRLTVDNNGKVWVIIWSNTSLSGPDVSPMWWGEKIRSFSSTGTPGSEITDFYRPLALAVDQQGLLLVGGLNEHSQIWKYNVSGTPSKVGTFGANGGIFGGTPGAFTNEAKLHWIKSIVVDGSGDIYTACIYGTFWGGAIEKWNSSGQLQYRLFAGTSLDCGGIDPENETEVYSKYHHYSLDYSKRTPGTEWSLKGFTVNRFKYPNDIRVDHHTDVISRSLGKGAFRIGGKLFVARSHQEGYELELFRQETTTDGEVLVPSVMMATGGEFLQDGTPNPFYTNQFYNPTSKTWIKKPKVVDLYVYGSYNIAKNGDLYGIIDKKKIVLYKYGGLDEFSNPIWDASNAFVYPCPTEFEDVSRISYDSDADVMYMAGDYKRNSEGNPEYGSFLHVKKFANWSTGNRTSSYTVNMPYNDQSYTPELNYGGGTPVVFTTEGDYIFITYGYGHIRILNKSNGALVGTLVQDVANGWHGSQGQVDADFGMTAFKRSNGEYVLLFENAAWANIMMHRWCPTGDCVEGATNQSPTVSITSPSNNSNFNTPASITINATAADADGTISKVEFYNGNTLIGSDNSSPYSITWTNVAAGNYSITAKATDNGGASTTSATISVNVSGTIVLRDPENPSNTVNGLDYTYYNGTWNNLPDFATLTAAKTGTTAGFSLSLRTQNDNFAFRFTGFINVPADGNYTFYTASDDGSKLYIGSTEVVNNDGLHGTDEKSGSIGLKAGKHAITVTFFEKDGGEELNISYSSPAISKTAIPVSALFRSSGVTSTLRDPENPANTENGLDYGYYEGVYNVLPDFNSLTSISTGVSTGFDISKVAKTDNFAFRFNGFVNIPSDGDYTFYTSSDDGSKLYIGTTEVVNNDGLHGTVEKSGKIGLKAGKHAITVTFFEKNGGQVLSVSYSSIAISKTAIPASALYKNSSAQAPTGNSDLIVTDILQSVTNGQATFTAVVKNQGTGNAPAGIIKGVAFMVNGAVTNWSDTHTALISPGASVSLTANGGPNGVGSWTAATSAYSVVAHVDDVNRITESNEGNNTFSKAFTIVSAARTGLNETVFIYPNPAKTEVVIALSEDINSVTILNGQGNEVAHKVAGNEASTKMNVSGLPTGLYLVKVYTSEGKLVTKSLIVE